MFYNCEKMFFIEDNTCVYYTVIVVYISKLVEVMFKIFFLSLFIVGASVCNASPHDHTWDDGRPMTDWEYYHIGEVYLGGD